ncbi:MAG: hypothetical protein FWG70_10360 [Oscillospiraceae bacterium]|nr:hypothetical protein [Oscillospiraceae bacterium]
MKIKKIIAILITAALAVALATGLLAGCGGNNGESLPERDRTSDTTTPPTEEIILNDGEILYTGTVSRGYKSDGYEYNGYDVVDISCGKITVSFILAADGNEVRDVKISIKDMEFIVGKDGQGQQANFDSFSQTYIKTVDTTVEDFGKIAFILARLQTGGENWLALTLGGDSDSIKGSLKFVYEHEYNNVSLPVDLGEHDIIFTAERKPTTGANEPSNTADKVEITILTVTATEFVGGNAGNIFFDSFVPVNLESVTHIGFSENGVDINMPPDWNNWFENATVKEVTFTGLASLHINDVSIVDGTLLYVKFIIDGAEHTVVIGPGEEISTQKTETGYILLVDGADANPAGSQATPALPNPNISGASDEIIDGRFVATKKITVEVFDRQKDEGTPADKNVWSEWIKKSVLEELNIEIEWVVVPRWEEEDIIIAMLASGSAPDVCYTYNQNAVTEYGEMVLLNLEPYFDGHKEILPNVWGLLGSDGIHEAHTSESGEYNYIRGILYDLESNPVPDRIIFFPSSNREPLASALYVDWISRADVIRYLQIGEEGVSGNSWVQNSPRNIDYTMTFNGDINLIDIN